MISSTMRDALNQQVQVEFHSSYLYLSMAAYFESLNLQGFAHWMQVQYQEEVAHGMKFFHHIIDRGGVVALGAIAAPQTSWASPLAVVESILAHERKITGNIHKLVDLAIAERDHASNQFLQWFVGEQVEEESSVSNIVERVRMVGESKGGLLYLDKELKKRTAAV